MAIKFEFKQQQQYDNNSSKKKKKKTDRSTYRYNILVMPKFFLHNIQYRIFTWQIIEIHCVLGVCSLYRNHKTNM